MLSLYVTSGLLACVLFRLSLNLLSDTPIGAGLMQELMFSVLFFGVVALVVFFWGTSKFQSVVISTLTCIVLSFVPFLLVRASRPSHPFTPPLLLVLLTVAKSVLLNLIALIPLYRMWPTVRRANGTS